MNQHHWDDALLRLQPKQQYGKILQITDPHIFAEDDGCLLGLNTRHSLSAVIEDVKAHHMDSDLILATGDISQDHSKASYDHFAAVMETIGIPVAWIPGNHDTSDHMADSLQGEYFVSNKQILVGDWHIILLDSSVQNAVHGELGREQLVFLQDCLTNSPAKYALPVLHHHPVDIGCKWMEPIGLHDGQALLSTLYGFPSVKALVWGHIHQDYDAMLNGIRMLATPSTAVQFKPGSDDFAAGEESPGYRTLYLHPDGNLETLVHRIDHIEFTVDYTIKGY